MAAIAFDTLKAARRMIAAGMPVQQAEAQAEVMAEAFVFNMESLVTQDYLDARLGEHDARVNTRFSEQDARIDKHFAQVETRFAEQDARIDKHFSEIETRLIGQNARIDLGFSTVNGQVRLVYWMLTVVILSTTVPAIRELFSG